MAKEKIVGVRVLSEIAVGASVYKPNAVVGFKASRAKQLVKEGMVDDSEDAVAYCISQGEKPVLHPDDNPDSDGGDGESGSSGAEGQ